MDALSARLPEIADRYVGRVRDIVGYREANQLADAELRDTAVECLGMLIHCLVDGEMSAQLLPTASSLGARRAAQAVPAEALATAVQLNFGVIWSELLELCGPKDSILLTSRVDLVWRVVDRFTAQVISSYHEERGRLAQEQANLRQVIVSRLFASDTPSAELVARVADELGIDEGDEYSVVVADRAEAQQRLHWVAGNRRYPRFVAHTSDGRTSAFWPATLYRDAMAELLSPLPSVRFDRIKGLGEVPSSTEAAFHLLDVLAPETSRLVELDEGLPILSRHALRTLRIDVTERLEATLASASPGERERIHETVVVYLESGSIQETATQLYCHRNTVLNRLTRFQELTGLDPTVPRQAAIVVLAWSTITGPASS